MVVDQFQHLNIAKLHIAFIVNLNGAVQILLEEPSIY
jgi:hypothetical protein